MRPASHQGRRLSSPGEVCLCPLLGLTQLRALAALHIKSRREGDTVRTGPGQVGKASWEVSWQSHSLPRRVGRQAYHQELPALC